MAMMSSSSAATAMVSKFIKNSTYLLPSTTTTVGYAPVIGVDLATYPYTACLNVSSDEECIAAYRPPIRHDLAFTVSMTFVYSMLAVAGIFGNFLVIVVVCRLREMRSGPNLYLLNLAIADLLLVATGLPLELHEYWYAYPHAGGPLFGPALCIFRHWSSEACAYATVLTICAFTSERALVIYCSTLVSPSRSANVRRVSHVIVVIWIVASIFAALVSYQWRIQYVIAPDGRELHDSAICVPAEELNSPALFIVPVFIFFFVPMGLITIVYLTIWKAVKRMSHLLTHGYFEETVPSSGPAGNSVITSTHNRQQNQQQQFMQMMAIGGHHNNNNNSPNHPISEQPLLPGSGGGHNSTTSHVSSMWGDQSRHNDRRTTAVIKVQTAVTLTFFVCWAPFHAQRLVVTFGHPEQWTENELMAYHVFNAIAGALYYLEACINPAIYNLLSKKFRHAFHSTLLLATDAKVYCRLFQTPHKALMARLYGAGRLDGPPVVTAAVQRPHMFGVDSAILANVAMLQQQNNNGANNNNIILNSNNFAGAAFYRPFNGNNHQQQNNVHRSSFKKANTTNNNYRGGVQQELIELGGPSNNMTTNNNSIRRQMGTVVPILATANNNNTKRFDQKVTALFGNGDRNNDAAAMHRPASTSPEDSLCQFCKHSPRQRSSSILIPASSRSGSDYCVHSSLMSPFCHNNNNSNKNSNKNSKMLLLRRNSDIVTASTSQMMREQSSIVAVAGSSRGDNRNVTMTSNTNNNNDRINFLPQWLVPRHPGVSVPLKLDNNTENNYSSEDSYARICSKHDDASAAIRLSKSFSPAAPPTTGATMTLLPQTLAKQ